MASSSSSLPPPPLLPRAVPPPQLQPPPPDTTLTLALSLSPAPLACAASPRPPHARRPRLPDGAFARVRSLPAGDTPPCTECGKRFPSWKALFGHMRCHPERQWRGITPPPPSSRAGGSPLGPAFADQFTEQEREVAETLLMLAGARPRAGRAKKSPLASPTSKESCGTSASPALAPALATVKCDDHKCSVCSRGFATGQALGGHKRCHWEKASEEAAAVASSGCSSASATSEVAATVEATVLDLNLAPPGLPLPQKNDQGDSSNAMLDMKLGY